MTLYAESSAILAWLLEQPGGWQAYDDLRAEELVVTSELTMIECDRALHRHVAVGQLATKAADGLRDDLAGVSSTWAVAPMAAEIVGRARASFPDDRIRTLDAIHLASAMAARDSLGEVALLTLDDRIRATGLLLGFRVLPA